MGHVQVLGTEWHGSKGYEGAGWYHCKAMFYHTWKIMSIGWGPQWQKERQMSHPTPRKARRRTFLSKNKLFCLVFIRLHLSLLTGREFSRAVKTIEVGACDVRGNTETETLIEKRMGRRITATFPYREEVYRWDRFFSHIYWVRYKRKWTVYSKVSSGCV